MADPGASTPDNGEGSSADLPLPDLTATGETATTAETVSINPDSPVSRPSDIDRSNTLESPSHRPSSISSSNTPTSPAQAPFDITKLSLEEQQQRRDSALHVPHLPLTLPTH